MYNNDHPSFVYITEEHFKDDCQIFEQFIPREWLSTSQINDFVNEKVVVPVPFDFNGILNDIFTKRFDHPCLLDLIKNLYEKLLYILKTLILKDEPVLQMCKKYCTNYVVLQLTMN